MYSLPSRSMFKFCVDPSTLMTLFGVCKMHRGCMQSIEKCVTFCYQPGLQHWVKITFNDRTTAFE